MSRPDLILHIGQSKTGTSSIQRSLGASRAALRAEGVLYPLSPGAANHALLPASLVPVSRLGDFHPNVWEGLDPAVRLDRFRREFAAELDAIGPDIRRVVISAEQCSGLLYDAPSITRLRDLLAPRFASIQVVIYLRRQDEHFASGYTQALRVGVIRPPALPEGGPERHPAYDYAALLDRWARVFGEAAIRPRVFERQALLNGDAVDDFLALCGLRLSVPPDHPARQSNLSVTPGGLALMLAMGQHLQASQPGQVTGGAPLWRRFVQSVSEAMPGRGWRPAPAEAQAFLARFSASNAATCRRWFPDRERLFESPPPAAVPGTAAPGPDLSATVALGAACDLLLRELSQAQAREAAHALQLGRLHEKRGDAAAARRSFAAALRAMPDHADAHFALARFDLAAGDQVAAAARLDAIRRTAPGSDPALRLERLLRNAAAKASAPSGATPDGRPSDGANPA